MQSSKPIVWNYGGGKQSVAMGVLIAEGRLPMPERALIVDTGREASTTWRYLTNHMQPVLDTVGLTIEIVPHSYSSVDLYDKHGAVLIPGWTKGGTGQLRTFCSGEWKRDAAYRWLREPERGYGPQNPIYQWLGYSLDEIGPQDYGNGRAWRHFLASFGRAAGRGGLDHPRRTGTTAVSGE